MVSPRSRRSTSSADRRRRTPKPRNSGTRIRQPFAASVSWFPHAGIEREPVKEYEGAPPPGFRGGGDLDVAESSDAWHRCSPNVRLKPDATDARARRRPGRRLGAAAAHEEFGGRRNLALEAQVDGPDAVHLAAMPDHAQERHRTRLLAAAAVRDHLRGGRIRQRRKRIVAERVRISDGLHDFGLRRERLEARLTLAGIGHAFGPGTLTELGIGHVRPQLAVAANIGRRLEE